MDLLWTLAIILVILWLLVTAGRRGFTIITRLPLPWCKMLALVVLRHLVGQCRERMLTVLGRTGPTAAAVVARVAT